MSEDAAIAGNSASDNVSVSELQAPLSPIVGSGRARIKFRSRRKHRPQQKLESVVTESKAQSLQLKRAIINLEAVEAETVPSTSKSDLSRTTTNLDIILRLKELEDLKVQKTNVVRAISVPVSKKPLEIKPTTKTEATKQAMKLLDGVRDNFLIENNSVSHYDEDSDGFRGFSRASLEKSEACQSASNAKDICFNDLKSEKNASVQQNKDEAGTSNTPKKLPYNIFQEENFDDLMLAESVGFDFVNKNIASTSILPKKCTNIKADGIDGSLKNNLALGSGILPKNNIFEGEAFDDLKLENSIGFKKATDYLETKKSAPLKINQDSAFSSSSSNHKLKNIFEGENFDDLDLKACSFQSSSAKMQKPLLAGEKLNARNIFQGENFDDLDLKACGFKTASANMRKAVNDNSKAKSARNIFEGENFDDLSLKFGAFQSASASMGDKKPLKTMFEGEKSAARNIFGDENFSDLGGIQPVTAPPPKPVKKFQCPFKTPLKSPSKNSNNTNSGHNTPENNLLKKSSKKRLGCSYRGYTPTISIPEKSLKRGRLMFEEIEEEIEAKRIRTSTPLKSLAKPLSCDITPIQKNNSTSITLSDTTLTSQNNHLSINKSTQGNVQDWLENLSKEKRILEEKLRIINEKQAILNKDKSKTSILPGVLFKSKNTENRMSLKNYIGNCSVTDGQIDYFLNEISPQNAHLVHFNICDDNKSHVKSLDGAEIVPNATNQIGLPEISHSFRLLDGVDPALIPKGWIDNHFRWIVWKLASYDRWTKGQFQECLSAENVMQQLKYRYDLEIDNAKRSILRRIFEKDDCSQRRMVLCVSNIMQKNHTYELELTDGWYSIRTVIDRPLCEQITKAKIKIGLKLMIYGSEIINCDQGCHPLEAKDFVYLKINYNCTRRALWWCKLGDQQESGPFLVPMSSVCPNGGKIGRLRCFILRVYPIQYMEKIGHVNVWRNRKAEERREQESHKKGKSCSYKNLQYIQDPELLFDLIQNSNDPEELQELLTSSQKTILYNYSITNKSASFSNKTVTAMLKIKLMDTAENSTEIRDFFIWRPRESHLDELKEGDIVTIFNVNCNAKWGLGAGKLTEFKREAKAKDERFSKFKRKATKFDELPYIFRRKFCEFDCVGFVVGKQIEADCQKVWLADRSQSLLLIRIEDSPHNVLVLDTVNEGQIISVCNLFIKRCFEMHFLAIGGLSVIFARYSQHKHLQEALEETEKDFENLDRERFHRECQQKISKIEGKSAQHMDGMECSQITITDMALLECMDKLTG